MPETCLQRIAYRILSLLLGPLGLILAPPASAAVLKVVTTVAPITDMAKHVGGDAIQLHGLVPEGVNSHTFQPTPRDVRYLAEADLILLNGLHLDVPTEKLARSSGKAGVTIVKLGDHAIRRAEWMFDSRFPQAHGHPNPHLWLDATYAMRYARLMRDQLSRLDTANQAVYQANTAQYLRHLTALDQCITTAVATIPPPHRTLLTYHDAWPYFARRYGMTVLGAVQPASFSEPSAREVARIIRQIRRSQAPAIFGSAVFPSRILEKIAAETGVQYVDTLRDDDLPGAPGDAEHSYIGMMLVNLRTMVAALGGDPATLRSCTTAVFATKD